VGVTLVVAEHRCHPRGFLPYPSCRSSIWNSLVDKVTTCRICYPVRSASAVRGGGWRGVVPGFDLSRFACLCFHVFHRCVLLMAPMNRTVHVAGFHQWMASRRPCFGANFLNTTTSLVADHVPMPNPPCRVIMPTSTTTPEVQPSAWHGPGRRQPTTSRLQ
jgi:hypothetical protein